MLSLAPWGLSISAEEAAPSGATESPQGDQRYISTVDYYIACLAL